MNGRQAVEYIHSFYGMGKKAGLENGFALMELLGNPHKRLKCIHVAGTNGKGSICAYIERVLRAQGYKTGLYTSPYLQRYNERIRVDGMPIDDDDLAVAVSKVKAAVDILHERDIRPTEFEVGTAAAFLWFQMAGVDYAIIEVGLGGRLDPTNIITPLVSVIGNIGIDHEKILGDTVEQIAAEKAGIIKPGVPVVMYPQGESVRKVVEEVARRNSSPFIYVEKDKIENVDVDLRGASFGYAGFDIRINIPGKHQVLNGATALRALLALRELEIDGAEMGDESVVEGFKKAFWPGRLEWMSENIIIDGAHNPQGAKALADYVKDFLPGKKIALIFGVQQQKPYEGIAEELARVADFVLAVEPDSHKALPAQELADLMQEKGVDSRRCDDLAQALDYARVFAGDEGYIIIAGSLYLAGEARTLLGTCCG
ncbi:MAG: bifunctional folylpolyglutamate synthase/dihydrofolate synthase [Christensenellales bacterium]